MDENPWSVISRYTNFAVDTTYLWGTDPSTASQVTRKWKYNNYCEYVDVWKFFMNRYVCVQRFEFAVLLWLSTR